MQLELSYPKRIKWFDNSQVKFFTIFRRFLLFYWISFPLVGEDFASFLWLFSSNKELGFFLYSQKDCKYRTWEIVMHYIMFHQAAVASIK